MKILVTGGLGYVGGRLVQHLARHADVIVSSRKRVSAADLAAYSASAILHTDLLSAETFPEAIDVVVHLAAVNEIDCVSFPSEAIRVNIDETRMILEHAIARGVKRFIYFSTAHVYGAPLTGVITENTLPLPAHPYAITHKAAEDYVLAANAKKKIQGTVVRLSNSFGAPVSADVNRWTLLANDLARQAVETGRLKLQSNGLQYRDFICLSDVTTALQLLINRGAECNHTTYNLGAGKSLRVIDMARQIADVYDELFNKAIPVETPANCTFEDEPGLDFCIDRLLSEGIQIENDTKGEIRNLLHFCAMHFSPERE